MEIAGEAGSGDEALELAFTLKPDVLLLDMNMPGITGPEVCRSLQEAHSKVRVLALSAYQSIHYIMGALEHGAYGYLIKDEIPESILAAVRGVAGGEKGWLSRQVSARIMKYREEEAALQTSDLSKLSRREQDVMGLIGEGCDNLVIAARLSISEGTVKNHVTNIYNKLNLHSRAEAVAWAWEHQLVKRSDED